MTKFEQWFLTQDFSTEMRFIHGDRLFDKDGDVYRVLPVQMTWVAWGKKPELGKPFDFDLFDSQKEKVEQLESKNKALVHALVGANEEKAKWARDYWKQVERLAEYDSIFISSDESLEVACFKKEKQIERLKVQVSEFRKLVKSLRNEFDLNCECEQVERQIELLEQAMRGKS